MYIKNIHIELYMLNMQHSNIQQKCIIKPYQALQAEVQTKQNSVPASVFPTHMITQTRHLDTLLWVAQYLALQECALL